MKQAGSDVIGLDWRLPLDEGWNIIGHDHAVQGNLDPALLFAPLTEIKAGVHDILRRAEGRPGHIFNLGHGILQHTPVENVKAVVDMVHEFSPTVRAPEGTPGRRERSVAETKRVEEFEFRENPS